MDAQYDQPPFGLTPLTLEDWDLFTSAFETLAAPISDYTFANTFVWSASLALSYRRANRHLSVFANGAGDLTLLLPPIPEPGAGDADLRCAILEDFEIMNDYNAHNATIAHSRIEYVSDEMVERISAVTGRGLTLSATPMSGDFVYSSARMIDLAGGDLKSKRHARDRFVRDYPGCSTSAMTPEDEPICQDLLDLWLEAGDANHVGEVTTDTQLGTDILRDKEIAACRVALQYYRELGLAGMVLRIDGRIIGFTLGEALSSMQASILFEKTHPDYRGAAQYIFSEFCRQYWSEYPEINAGDDWGIPGLRFSKQQYRPIRIINKSMLTIQPVVVTGGSAFSPGDLPEMAPSAAVSATPVSATDENAVMLRSATAEELDQIVELEAVCFRNLEESFNRRQVRDLIRNQRALVLVAKENGRVAGWAVGLVRQHRHNRSGRLYALAVHPAFRGRGYGQRLVSGVIENLHARGIDRLFLEVRHDNAAAIALYERLGFTTSTFLPDYYGEGRHGFRMKIELAPASKTALFVAMPSSTSEEPVRSDDNDPTICSLLDQVSAFHCHRSKQERLPLPEGEKLLE